MSIEALFNHRALQYRPLATDDERNRGDGGEVLNLFELVAVPAGDNCRPDQAWSGVLQDGGPGEEQDARRRWFLHRRFNAIERDVLLLVEGDHAGLQLRLHSVTPQRTRRRLHHIEVNVEVWDGEIEVAEVES